MAANCGYTSELPEHVKINAENGLNQNVRTLAPVFLDVCQNLTITGLDKL